MNTLSKMTIVSGIAFFAGFTYAPALLDAAPVKQVLQFKNVMIRGHGGKCLNIRHAGKKKGANVILQQCNGKPHQRWNVYGFTSSAKNLNLRVKVIKSVHSGHVLTVKTEKKKQQHYNVHMLPYGHHSYREIHHWKMNGRMIESNDGNGCIEVKNGSKKNGANIRVGPCKNQPHQRWVITKTLKPRFFQKNVLIKKQTGQCVEIKGANKNDRALVVLAKCSGKPHQRWNLSTDGTIRSALNGKCVQYDDKKEKNSDLLMQPCKGQYIGMWRYVSSKDKRHQILSIRSDCIMSTNKPSQINAGFCAIANAKDSKSWWSVETAK